MRRFLPLFAVIAVHLAPLACGKQSVAIRDTTATVPKIEPTQAIATRCGLTTGDIRVGPDSIAGLPTRVTFAELQRRCPTARIETIGVGGEVDPALRIEVAGATAWAIQDTLDTLDPTRTPEFWAVEGAGLHYPDGVPLPLVAGELRRSDSTAIVVVDHGDDTSGSLIVRCKFPSITVAMGNMWPTLHDTGVVSLAAIAASDTTRAWRVEIDTRRTSTLIRSACSRTPAT